VPKITNLITNSTFVKVMQKKTGSRVLFFSGHGVFVHRKDSLSNLGAVGKSISIPQYKFLST